MAQSTTSQKQFTLSRPSNNMSRFEFSSAHRTIIHLPRHSTWTPSPHWHETHTEHIRVLQGTILLMLNGRGRTIRATDGVQTIPAFAIHEWMRHDHGARLGLIAAAGRSTPDLSVEEGEEEDDDDVVVEEFTTPSDGLKEVFFRNLFSFLLLPTPARQNAMLRTVHQTLQIACICAAFDNWEVLHPVLTPRAGGSYTSVQLWLNWFVTHVVYGVLGVVAWLVGVRAARREFTPPELWAVARVAEQERFGGWLLDGKRGQE